MLTTSSPAGSNALISSCLATIAQLIPVSAVVFYLLDTDLQSYNYVLHDNTDTADQQYLEHFQQVNPLKLVDFYHQHAYTDTTKPTSNGNKNHYNQNVILGNNIYNTIEIFIRQHKQFIAGVSLIRDTPFTELESIRLRAVLPLIELATCDLLPSVVTQQLTAKEQEIVNMVREGASNKRIALKLGISLSTVKTHMRNIFAKTDVANRTELASWSFISPVKNYAEQASQDFLVPQQRKRA